MRPGNLYALVLTILFTIPGVAFEYVRLDSLGEDAVHYHRLPNHTLVLFVTDKALHTMLPDQCQTEEGKGFRIQGYFERGDIGPNQVYVLVDNPRHWDHELVVRCAKLFGHILDGDDAKVYADIHGFNDQDWDRAGVLFHELSHLCDSNHAWWGKPHTMMHELFPDLVSAAPADEHEVNPWAILRVWWPQWCTHEGYDAADYHKLAGHR